MPMNEGLSWSLSDGPPDAKHFDGKANQRDTETVSYGDRPTRLPADLRRTTKYDPHPPGGDDRPLRGALIAETRADARHVAERMQRYIDQGVEADPLAGATERGGYVRGERDGI